MRRIIWKHFNRTKKKQDMPNGKRGAPSKLKVIRHGSLLPQQLLLVVMLYCWLISLRGWYCWLKCMTRACAPSKHNIRVDPGANIKGCGQCDGCLYSLYSYREASCPASATRELEKVSVREKTEWLYCTTFWHFAEHCPQLAKLFEVGSACK